MRTPRRPSLRTRIAALAVALLAALTGAVTAAAPANATDDLTWTAAAPPGTDWRDVAYGNGLFVAVSISGTRNRVMTSPDGISWTQQTTPPDHSWDRIDFCGGLFIVTTGTYTAPRAIMTSPDGITWTPGTPTYENSWLDSTCGNGVYVVVGQGSGTGGDDFRIMWSANGSAWTAVNTGTGPTPPRPFLESIAFGSGKFVALNGAASTTTDRVWISSDGANWTQRPSANDSRDWSAVTYGGGQFVAVADSNIGSGGRVMTSPDGITWTQRSTAGDAIQWRRVTYGNGLFVAVGASGNVMSSTDGVTWTLGSLSTIGGGSGIAYGAGRFVSTYTRAPWISYSNPVSGPASRPADPAAWMTVHQALPANPDGSCTGLTDDHVGYGTQLTGGWAPSWQEWAGPQGGPVCTRTLVNRGAGWTFDTGS